MSEWFDNHGEMAGGVLFFGAITAAVVLQVVGVTYGWGAIAVLGAFVTGALLLSRN